jgi:hypothetical protein
LAAERVEGSGRVVDDARDLPPFRRLVVDGPIDVTLVRGAAERATVHADDNLLPLVQTRVAGGTLSIGARPKVSFRTRNRLRVTLQFRELEALRVLGSGRLHADFMLAPITEIVIRGSGDVAIDDLQSDVLAVSITGSGDLTVAGHADKLGAVLTGSGDLRADKLQSREAALRLRGSGDARVHATGSLQVDIAGAGDVRYRGEPKISKQIKGGGDVAPLH